MEIKSFQLNNLSKDYLMHARKQATVETSEELCIYCQTLTGGTRDRELHRITE